ncbi:class I SAM-dependent methyltransferase [Streptomyces sp. NBC_00237]|uniref:class I SAM-dependent methyltransferase n=1 Tax=Streptomyces sp. NBC_00237 TaxID=2975687 RepID=UPI0022582C9E|nr:class I SAM-dependent methyltransferase [Streptomyces sp. NBC_00237]MCX5205535.1 class I SAM-dependent methyltransferase [Streptomyces sp. NBC_00237]
MEQYDAIGSRFMESKTTAAFSAADTHSLLLEVGDVAGVAALDLACGYGHNTRLLADRGARPVVGVDVSPEMIGLARSARDDRIEFVLADVVAMPVIGKFGLATAVYLFHYAPTREALRGMFRSIRANLSQEGRLVAIVPNPSPYPEANWDDFDVTVRERVATGTGSDVPLLKAAFLTDPPIPYEFWEWQRDDLERAAVESGFSDVRWKPISTPPAHAQQEEEVWAKYRANPVSSLLVCHAR